MDLAKWASSHPDNTGIPEQEIAASSRVETPEDYRSSDTSGLFLSSANSAERGQAIAAACFASSLRGGWDQVLRLIAGGNVDLEQTYRGRTALMIAAEHPAALPVLKLLVGSSADCCFVGL
jgi:hypothetical protein